jgi:hypothetical protein
MKPSPTQSNFARVTYCNQAARLLDPAALCHGKVLKFFGPARYEVGSRTRRPLILFHLARRVEWTRSYCSSRPREPP